MFLFLIHEDVFAPFVAMATYFMILRHDFPRCFWVSFECQGTSKISSFHIIFFEQVDQTPKSYAATVLENGLDREIADRAIYSLLHFPNVLRKRITVLNVFLCSLFVIYGN